MSRDDLSVRQRAVLFALLGEARPVANTELEALIGVRLDGAERRDLNRRRLVESTRAGRTFAHELSDAGWRWCGQQLTAAAGERAGSLERAHHRVFGLFARHLDAAGLTLADIARPAPADAATGQAAPPDLPASIEAGYRSLAAAPGQFVALRELRLRLPARPRPEVDAALAALFAAQRINLIPQSDQRALTDADRAAALRVGGEHKHLISIE